MFPTMICKKGGARSCEGRPTYDKLSLSIWTFFKLVFKYVIFFYVICNSYLFNQDESKKEEESNGPYDKGINQRDEEK